MWSRPSIFSIFCLCLIWFDLICFLGLAGVQTAVPWVYFGVFSIAKEVDRERERERERVSSFRGFRGPRPIRLHITAISVFSRRLALSSSSPLPPPPTPLKYATNCAPRVWRTHQLSTRDGSGRRMAPPTRSLIRSPPPTRFEPVVFFIFFHFIFHLQTNKQTNKQNNKLLAFFFDGKEKWKVGHWKKHPSFNLMRKKTFRMSL